MDRNLHKKYIPNCPRQAAVVDQYSWPQKDTNQYMCYNGISHPIYDCKGDINYTLPLEMYPKVGAIHPQIGMVKRPHLNFRNGNLSPSINNEILKYRINHIDNQQFGSRYPSYVNMVNNVNMVGGDNTLNSTKINNFNPINDVNTDYYTGRIEGLYYQPKNDMDNEYNRRSGCPTQMLNLQTDNVPGYPLPNPYGDTRSCNKC